jgi:hypothetical protein
MTPERISEWKKVLSMYPDDHVEKAKYLKLIERFENGKSSKADSSLHDAK